MKEYFSLQLVLLNRWFKDTGVPPIVGYVVAALVFVGGSFLLFSKTTWAVYIYILAAVAMVSQFSETDRNEFLQTCFGDSKKHRLRIMENLLAVLPFALFLVYKQHYIHAIMPLVAALLLAFANFRVAYSITLPTPFYKRPFEFTVGFRNTFLLLMAAYILAVIACFVGNFNLGIFALLSVCAIALSYYTKPEHEFYVWTYSMAPKKFLYSKIETACLFSLLLNMPVVLLLCAVFYTSIHFVLLFLVVGLVFMVYIVVLKYSAYPREINLPEGFLIALCVYLPPLLLVFIPYFFSKASRRLSSILK